MRTRRVIDVGRMPLEGSAPDTHALLSHSRGHAGPYASTCGLSLEQIEESLVRQAMRLALDNQTHAARLLGISRDALRYRLKKFGISDSGASGDHRGVQAWPDGADGGVR